MKRLSAVLLCFVLVLSGCGASAAEGSAQTLQEYLLARSLAQTWLLGSMAGAEEYGSLYSSSPEILELMGEIGAVDFENPRRAVVIRLPADAIRSFMEQEMGGELGLTGEISDLMEAKMFESIPNLIMGQQGTDFLVVANILGLRKSYQKHGELVENAIVILLYPGNYHTMTTFVESEEETVTAQTVLIVFHDAMLAALKEESLERFLSREMNFTEVTVEYLDSDAILGK